jgi:hypothetical protein
VERYWCPRGRLRGRRRFTRGGGALRGRCWNLLKNFLVGGLEFGDLAHHLILTGGQLIDTFSHVGKVPLDGLSHRGNIRLYLLYLLRVEAVTCHSQRHSTYKPVSSFRQPLECCGLLGCHWPIGAQRV